MPLPRRRLIFSTCLIALCAAGLRGCGGSGASTTTTTPAAPDGPPWFEECAAARGIIFTHVSGHQQRHLMPEIMGGGAALFDMDNDGDLDAYLVQSGSLTGEKSAQPTNKLFRNNGDGTFTDITAGSGADDRGYGMGVACGDFDNDGFIDLYITNVGPNVLLRNNGDGTFTNVTESAGVGHAGWGASAAFFDMDNDGDLDLFVTNYLNWSVATEIPCYNTMGAPDYCSPQNYNAPAMDVLYRNNGDGTFTDVTDETGVSTNFGTGLGIAVADFDRNGWLDVFVANDGMPDQLWMNRNGRFTDAAVIMGCAIDQEGKAKAGMGVAVADLDDDGDSDLIVCNLNRESDSFFRNDGQYFSDITAIAGLAATSRPFTRFGMGFLDFDNDGWLDLYQANGRVMRQAITYSDDAFAEPNILKKGQPGMRFTEVRPRGGTAALLPATSRAAAFGDIDNDGGIDILVVNRDGPAHLLRNIAPGRSGRDNRGWIGFKVLDEHSRDAFNATVSFKHGERTITRDVRAAYSYLASNDPRIHVGLGEAPPAAISEVTVRWIGGATEVFGPFAPGQYHTIRKGQGRAK